MTTGGDGQSGVGVGWEETSLTTRRGHGCVESECEALC